jgi:hypothetical protein
MRRKRVVESFENAAKCIGPIEKDMSLFAITRGQFSMIDAIFHVLHEARTAAISVWTSTVASCCSIWLMASFERAQKTPRFLRPIVFSSSPTTAELPSDLQALPARLDSAQLSHAPRWGLVHRRKSSSGNQGFIVRRWLI